MRYTFSFILALASLTFLGFNAQAATLSPGDLIKASGPAVYYYSQEGKRLVFPNENTYKTWYADFNQVKTITDNELASVTMGGNITYKPGVRLVKIVSDPKVYAIAAGGTLRHVTTESIASTLYGDDWNKKVDDIPVGFFSNYKQGTAIINNTDYSPSQTSSLATNIDVDRGVTTTNPPTCTTCQTTSTEDLLTITLSSSQNTVKINDVLSFTATANYSKGIKQIRIYFDGQLVTACDYTNNCSGSSAMGSVADKSIYQAKVVVTTLDLKEGIKTLDIPLASSTEPDPEVSIMVDREVIEPGQETGITVQANETVDVKEIVIYIDDGAKKGCNYLGRSCKWSQIFDGPVGTEFTTYGIVTNVNGATYRTATKTITLAENSIPQVTAEAGKTYIFPGEMMDVVVNASDEDGIQSIEILDTQKNVLKHCDGAAACIMSTGPWPNKGTIVLWGKATDKFGASNEQPITFNVQ